MSSTTKKSTLFLHSGPGGSSRVERLWLGESDSIDWWDQPRTTSEAAFSGLLKIAENKLHQSVEDYGAPVHVLTSSFGCEIGVHLVRCMPDHVRSLVMLCPVFDVPAGFVGLAEAQLAYEKSADLALALAAYRDAPSRSLFWGLIGSILASPRIFDRYWGHAEREKMDSFAALLGENETFDRNAFQMILNDFLIPRGSAATGFTGPVTAILGAHDPFSDVEGATQATQLRFPHAVACVVDAGHFPHLEVSPALWEPEQLHPSASTS